MEAKRHVGRPVNEPATDFAATLDKFRQAQGSDQEAAIALGVSYPTFRNWRQGLRRPSAFTTAAVLEAIKKLSGNKRGHPRSSLAATGVK